MIDITPPKDSIEHDQEGAILIREPIAHQDGVKSSNQESKLEHSIIAPIPVVSPTVVVPPTGITERISPKKKNEEPQGPQ